MSSGPDQIDIDSVSEKLRDKVKYRAWIIDRWNAFRESYPDQKITDLMEVFVATFSLAYPEEPLSSRTLRRYIDLLNKEGKPGLVPKYKPFRKQAEFSEDAKKFEKGLYLSKNQPSMSFCMKETEKLAVIKHWVYPSRATRRRILARIRKDVKTYARKGPKAWLELDAPCILRDPESMAPGEIYVGDHYQINVAVRPPKGYTGKKGYVFPYMTVWMDHRTRKIMSFVMVVYPNARTTNESVIEAIEICLCTDLFIDNGREFDGNQVTGDAAPKRFRKRRNIEFAGSCACLGIKPHFNLVRNAQAKILERFFSTFHDGFEVAWSTYRGNKVENRPEGLEEKLKKGTDLPEWNEFRSCVADWITHYNNAGHTGEGMDGRSPNQVWDEYWSDPNHEKRILDDPSALNILRLPAKSAKVGRNGVRLNGSYYFSPELMELKGQMVQIRYNPRDLNEVRVHEMKGPFICLAQRRHKTPWNDEDGYKNLKSVHKKRKRAMVEEINTARAVSDALFGGYKKYGEEEPPKRTAKVFRVVRTPSLTGARKKIDSEKSSNEKGQLVQGRFSFEPKGKGEDKADRREKQRNMFMGPRTINEADL